MATHAALLAANLSEQGHRLVLDWIIGPLNMAGMYRTLLDDWLPPLAEADNQQIRGEALGQIGKQYHHIGQYDTALDYLQQSLAIRQEIGDKQGMGATLNNISQIYDARGDYHTALEYLQQSLAIQQEIGDVAGLCYTLFNIGHIHLQNEEVAEAVQAWVTVYGIAKQVNLAKILSALENLAGNIGLPGGLQGWEMLAQQIGETANTAGSG